MGRLPSLIGSQKALFEALSEKDNRLASMYLACLTILENLWIPDALSLAAHAIRELMEKLPLYLDLPVRLDSGGSLKNKVYELKKSYERVLQNSKCYNSESQEWSGIIDQHLKGFLKRLSEFFKWLDEFYPERKEKVRRIFKALDPKSTLLPETIRKNKVDSWMKLWDFFNDVAHHRNSMKLQVFEQHLRELEKLLLDHLKPKTFSDFNEIDEIIKEVETS